MFNICIVGHGNYPDGVISALKLISGTEQPLMAFNLNHELTHAAYESQLNAYLENNEQVIVFADMTGGAPHQIASRLILEKGTGSHYIISSAPLNLILDVLMKTSGPFLTKETVATELSQSLGEAQEMMLLLPEVKLGDAVATDVTEEGI